MANKISSHVREGSNQKHSMAKYALEKLRPWEVKVFLSEWTHQENNMGAKWLDQLSVSSLDDEEKENRIR